MPSTSSKINYTVRPAKSIERKMLVEAFRRLSAFGSVEAYRYIGFGAWYFQDFYLIHKSLGITNMINIEVDVDHQRRYEFNRPFDCIEMKWGTSTEVLPTLQWDVKTILWLDYDGKMDAGILDDLRTFCTHPRSGNVILVTLNAMPDRYDGSIVEWVKGHVGRDKVPGDIADAGAVRALEDRDLAGWGLARLYRRIVHNEIAEHLTILNGVRRPENHFLYKQLFNFHYEDGAKMITLGGVIYERDEEHKVAGAGFESLQFVRTGDAPYTLEVPMLTHRDIRYLDREIPYRRPSRVAALEKFTGIREADLHKYAELHRYFPTFAETDI